MFIEGSIRYIYLLNFIHESLKNVYDVFLFAGIFFLIKWLTLLQYQKIFRIQMSLKGFLLYHIFKSS